MGNPVCYAELQTNDPARAKAFYGSLFAWKLEDVTVNKQQYTICHVGGSGVPAGITRRDDGGRNRWIAFIEVLDVNQTLQNAIKLGAKVMVAATTLPGFGVMATFIDPTGAEVGLWKRGT